MKYLAKTLYQADPEWMVWVTLGECTTEQEAKELANDSNLTIRYDQDGLHLYVDLNQVGKSKYQHMMQKYNDLDIHRAFNRLVRLKTFTDSEVKVEKLKDDSFHQHLTEGWGYKEMDISIDDFKNYPGLISGFSSLAYEITPIPNNQ